jgi:hypothetical protein
VLVTLVIGNSTAEFGDTPALTYRFELYNAAGTIVYTAPSVSSGSGTTSHRVPDTVTLDAEQPYTWRARAEFQGLIGPWLSPRASFVSPPNRGYIRGNELYDPLLDGLPTTIGRVVGPVTFIPGVGAKLESFNSRIVYELDEPLEDGSISALVTNVATNTEGGKTKIFSMAQGYGDLTTNERRMTVEKRGDAPTGGIAWRFITNRGAAETVGSAQRMVREFNPSETYFWEADFRDGFFRVRIRRGGVNGTEMYNFGKPYEGFYRAEPHVIYLGGGPARGGAESMTVPGMIIRQVWVSEKPRPAFASK